MVRHPACNAPRHNLTVILAEVFDPDRFIDARLHKYLTPNPFIFLPFNAGPRICLGQQVTIFLALATVFTFSCVVTIVCIS